MMSTCLKAEILSMKLKSLIDFLNATYRRVCGVIINRGGR